MKNTFFRAFFLSLVVSTGPLTMGEAEEMNFDDIVSDLRGSTEGKLGPVDPFDDIMIHAGLGLATSYLSVRPEMGGRQTGFLTGVEANFGIDLFSRSWQAETSLRSFNSEKFSNDFTASLKEFDLKIMHTLSISSKMKLRMGGGLAARYMKVDSNLAVQNEYTTPASIFDGALRAQLTPALGIGAEVSLRNALISESIDRSSLNAALRLDAQF